MNTLVAARSKRELPMILTGRMIASKESRLLTRVLQVLDTQRLLIHSFSGREIESKVLIEFTVSSNCFHSERVMALLYGLQAVQDVALNLSETDMPIGSGLVESRKGERR